jgi:hypothetical protein
MRSPLALVLIGFLRAYRTLISPLYGQVCRFHPSCSAYALEAVRTHGGLRGIWYAVRRLGRCHPWSAGGCTGNYRIKTLLQTITDYD